MSCWCPFQQDCTLGWPVAPDLIILMPNFHFFLFSLWQLINHLPAKDSLYSRQRQCFPRLYLWQLLGVGSCPDMLQQTQAILFIVKDQQGFLSFGGGLLVLFGRGVFLTSEASCAPPLFFNTFFLHYRFVSSFSLWETAFKVLFKLRAWNEKPCRGNATNLEGTDLKVQNCQVFSSDSAKCDILSRCII